LANTVVAIFRVNIWLIFWQPYVWQAVGGQLDVMKLIGGVEQQAG
jgi:hypothetical protein